MHQALYLAHHSPQQKQNNFHVNEVMAGLTVDMSVKSISMHKCLIKKSLHMPADKCMQKEEKTENRTLV